MCNMRKQTWTAAKILLRQNKVAYFVGGLMGLMLVASYITAIAVHNSQNTILSLCNVAALILVLASILTPARCLRKLINLGGKRIDFWRGSALAYATLSVCMSLVCILFYYTADDWMVHSIGISGVLSLIDVFGFMRHGALAAFFQYTVLWFFFAMFLHTLTLLQDNWIGWVADVLLVAIISVFTPIAPLRALEAGFFRMIIFQPNALLQILSCVVLSSALYALNLPILGRKNL